MRLVKRLPRVLVPVLLVLGGAAALLLGLAHLFGLDVALVVGGVLAVVAGLLLDV